MTETEANTKNWKGYLRQFVGRPENVLAVVAILFAVVQFTDARIQEQTMTEIAKSMSTRFIGLFPKNMNEVTEVVNGADNHLDVMTDFAGYGHYSNPEGFKTYFNAVLARRPKATVRMILYGPEQAAGSQTSQFEFDQEKTTDRFRDFFLKVHSGQAPPATAKDFNAVLDNYQVGYKKLLCDAGVQIRLVNHPLLFFMWLEDNDQAAFSFQNTGEREREISTRTQDANLMSPMHAIFIKTWNESQPLCNADQEHPALTAAK